jgi:hypothetical protein
MVASAGMPGKHFVRATRRAHAEAGKSLAMVAGF